MARRYNTAAIVSPRAPAAIVGQKASWLSAWTTRTGNTLIRTFPIITTLDDAPTLQLGDRLEIPAEALSIVRAPSSGTQIAGVYVVSGGSGYNSPPTLGGLNNGGGRGAQGTVTVDNGEVTGVIITNPGTGYTASFEATLSHASGTGARVQVILSGVETQTSVLQALQGETANDWWLQAHNGVPGAAGTDNVLNFGDRWTQLSTNWTTAT